MFIRLDTGTKVITKINHVPWKIQSNDLLQRRVVILNFVCDIGSKANPIRETFSVK